MGHNILTIVHIKIMVFWDVRPCGLVVRYWYSGGCSLHL